VTSPKYTFLDTGGRPFSPDIEHVLTSLTPRLLRQFPALGDESLLIAVLETAARKLTNRERESGPIERLHAYAWVTLYSTAMSRLRRGRGRLAQKLFESDQEGVSLEAMAATTGTAEQIERAVLLREVLAHLTPDERRVCLWKQAGFTSEEIAEYRGGTASAVHTLLCRARQKIRHLLGAECADARRDGPSGPSDNDHESLQGDGTDVEPSDDEQTRPLRFVRFHRR
jgi:RNA polymerase sigma factor (sigma-70 family)